MHTLQLLSLGLISLGFRSQASPAFNPRAYQKSVATCQATNRADGQETAVEINLSYVDINSNAKTSLILVHGWPSLWSTWSNQIQEFEDDYHLLVPDLRGFAESTHPGDVRSSGTMSDMVSDLVCILQHASIASAVCIGHDWGTQICYEAARMRPDLFRGVVGAVIPYIPSASDFVPIEHLVVALPKLSYQLFFNQNTQEAIAELDKDVRRTVRATLRSVTSPPPDDFLRSKESFLGGWADVTEIPPVPFFTPEEEDYFIEQFSIQGFKHTLQFYTEENRRASWAFAHMQGNHTIPQPVLSILPKNDPVADWGLASKILKSTDFLPNSRTEFMDGAHWCHIEYPTEFNALMRAWLKEMEDGKTAVHDEL
ncbi:Bifunctional epoxide hydrolase 2 [Mycena sanguinolenta]|uniref:Bifunctional epoxide hydrolase 2 n=1 Tax=Mycena sanguinolenta TaxID=230812 RepID=A0A8H6YA44_9AGAR|nr:Bifunctional epoxide hydrolase 2 [Mycena sanguinolenta]